MLLIAFKLITYGTARVKTSEHVNLCISLYTKNCLYHNFLPILAKYFPNRFQISMSTRCLIQWLCEDISVGGGCLRQGYFAYWPAHRAGLLWLNFFGQPGSVSKFPPLLWVKLWVGWVGRGYTEISRYFPASWIDWVTLVTKIKLLYSLRF